MVLMPKLYKGDDGKQMRYQVEGNVFFTVVMDEKKMLA
jgi:hypothetical protein